MIESLKIAVLAFVYVEILASDEMILGPVRKLVCKLPKFIHKPLISCSYCVAGQIAFWTNIESPIMPIAFSIFFVHIILIINQKLLS